MIGLIITGVLTLILSAAIQFTCTQHDRPAYRVPLFPYLPAASLLLNCFLMASLPARAYWQLALFFAIMIVFYLLYSVHAANRFETEVLPGVAVGSKAVDLEAPTSGDDSASGKTGAHDKTGVPGLPTVKRNSTILDRISTGATTGPVLGRRSAGVTRLPPPTL